MSAQPRIFRCNFCKKRLPTESGVSRHVQNTPDCRARWDAALEERHNRYVHGQHISSLSSEVTQWQEEHMDIDTTTISSSHALVCDRPVTVEEIPDEDSDEVRRFVQTYASSVAEILGKGETMFEQWRKENDEAQREHFFPFASEDEWELAVWLIQNVGHNKIEEFLKLKVVRSHHI